MAHAHALYVGLELIRFKCGLVVNAFVRSAQGNVLFKDRSPHAHGQQIHHLSKRIIAVVWSA